jgi:hypothetical protein
VQLSEEREMLGDWTSYTAQCVLKKVQVQCGRGADAEDAVENCAMCFEKGASAMQAMERMGLV